MKKLKKRVVVYVDQEVADGFAELALELGVTKSAAGQLAFKAGIKSLRMALDPDWIAHFEKLIREGKPLVIPGDSE